MDGRKLSKPQGSHHRRKRSRKAGLKVVQRGQVYHLQGTVTANGQSVRVRETTGVRVTAKHAREQAENLRAQMEADLIHRMVHGVKDGPTYNEAAVKYAEARVEKRSKRGKVGGLGDDTEYQTVILFTNFLFELGLDDGPIENITTEHMDAFFKEYHGQYGHQHSTMMRTWNPIRAVFNKAGVKPPKPKCLDEENESEIKGEAYVIGKWLYADEVELLIKCAAKHLQPLLTVWWNTGRRGSELYWLKRTSPDYTKKMNTGLCMEEGREHIYLGQTKNGKPRIAWLNTPSVDCIKAHLTARNDHYEELFLSHKGVPYKKPKKKRGGIIKSAFNTAKKKAAKILEKQGKPERAAVMRKATPHWARHNLTSHLLKAGLSTLEVQDQMGWSSEEMVKRYAGDMDGAARKRADLAQFTTQETTKKKGKRS